MVNAEVQVRDEGVLDKSENGYNNCCDLIQFYGFECHVFADDSKLTCAAWASFMIPESSFQLCLLDISISVSNWHFRSDRIHDSY